ncbi:MAG: hypothetical protein MJZ12_00530 [Prevotella sp.]|nr:hypothetical protein [Prevotella sp.]
MMNNELTTTNSQLMTPASNQVSLLEMRMDEKRFPRIGEFPREQAVFEVSKIVSQAFLYKGQAADPKNIQFISYALVDELQSDLDKLGTRHISFGEISRVVKRAVLQDDMYGISVASLYKVIIEYIKGEGHRLQQEVSERKRKSEQEQIKNSVIAPMLQAYAGELLKHFKV